MIDKGCYGVSDDPYGWSSRSRTKREAHLYIRDHWDALADGDIVDVARILGETPA